MESDAFTDLLDLADFQSYHLELTARSMVTGNTFHSLDGLALLGFVGPKSLLISAPRSAFRKGSTLTLDVYLAPSASDELKKVLSATAEAREVNEPVGEEDGSRKLESVQLYLLQYDPAQLQELENRFSGRQNEIDAFFGANRS
jgi:hypothetical protein